MDGTRKTRSPMKCITRDQLIARRQDVAHVPIREGLFMAGGFIAFNLLAVAAFVYLRLLLHITPVISPWAWSVVTVHHGAADQQHRSHHAAGRLFAPAIRSESARQKDATRVNADGLPVQSFQDLLTNLATLCRNRMRLTNSDAEFRRLSESTPLQRPIFKLLAHRS
jgi:hypothetical protein